MESELAVESFIGGHHVFSSVWTPTIGERKREIGNDGMQWRSLDPRLLSPFPHAKGAWGQG